MRKKYGKIRIVERGKTEKYPNQYINGDMLSTNKIYRDSIHFIINWKPDDRIKKFIDTHHPNYINKIKKNNVEVILYYPIDIYDLIIYLEEEYSIKLSSRVKRNIIKNNDIDRLINMVKGDK